MRKAFLIFILFSSISFAAKKKTVKRAIASTGSYICTNEVANNGDMRDVAVWLNGECDKKYSHSLSSSRVDTDHGERRSVMACCIKK